MLELIVGVIARVYLSVVLDKVGCKLLQAFPCYWVYTRCIKGQEEQGQ
jgi:hypothetical protein